MTGSIITSFVAGVVAGYGVAVPVGAIAVVVVGLTARTSLRVGAAAALGVATADGLYALVAVVGGVALADLVVPVATPMRWLSVVVLVGIAARTAVSAVRHRHDPDKVPPAGSGFTTPARAYGGLLGLTLLNPMTVVYFGALVLGRQTADEPAALGEVFFVLGAFLASASWQLLIAASGALVGRTLSRPHGRLITGLASSLLIVALAINLVLS